jgi:hypothetical protein
MLLVAGWLKHIKREVVWLQAYRVFEKIQYSISTVLLYLISRIQKPLNFIQETADWEKVTVHVTYAL